MASKKKSDAASSGRRKTAANSASRIKNEQLEKTTKAGKQNAKTTAKNRKKRRPTEADIARTREISVPDIRRNTGTPVYVDVLLIVWLAFCVILLLSNFFGIGGVIGNAISHFFFGMFGILAHLLPFLFFLCAVFLVANKGNTDAFTKVGAGFVLFLCACAICELLSNEYDASRAIADYYQVGSELKVGGGIGGGMLCKAFSAVFGVVGAWIFILVLVLITLIVLTGFSFVDSAKEKRNTSSRRNHKSRSLRSEMNSLKKEKTRLQREKRMQDEIDRLRTENESIELEIREPRRNRRVRGVTPYTTFDTSVPAAQEVHEVTAKVRHGVRAGAENVTQGQYLETDEDKAPVSTRRRKNRSQTTANPMGHEMAVPETQDNPVQRQMDHQESYDPADMRTSARRMVDSVEDSDNAQQLDLNFTIHRAGKVRTVPAFTAAELSLEEEPVSTPVMPEIEMPVVQKPIRQQERPIVKENILPVQTDLEMPSLHKNSAVSVNSANEEKTVSASDKIPRNPRSSREEQEQAVESVAAEIAENELIAQEKPAYVFPPIDLLRRPSGTMTGSLDEDVKETAIKLQQTLHNFGVNVTVTNVSCGPAVTRYELTPEQGVKVSRIVNLADDIKLNLAAADIRIEAPIPGKSAVGIEVPNKENSAVYLRELIESDEFARAGSKLSFAVGKDIAGKPVISDIAKMPHLLIAGATGSGKSVCINTLIMSILYKAHPDDVKLIMIDPKVVELSVYNGIPHLFIPVVTDPKKAAGALNWGVAEMTDRYNKFAETGVRDLKGYNAKIDALGKSVPEDQKPKKLPQIVIIVDELADLMMVAPGEVEDSICRLAQLARAAGIHLIIATQRPSVNVITGLIKANMPSRIAFSVTSGVDSRTILDMVGAEKLLGKGDMLFYPQGMQKPARVQGSFVSDDEVNAVTEFLTQKNSSAEYQQKMQERMSQVSMAGSSSVTAAGGKNDRDENFVDAGKFIIEKNKASIGMLQRVFKIGFNRAARIMDQLADAGVVGPEEGTKPRKILMSMEEFEQYIDEYV